MSNIKAAITGVHGYVPEYVLTNEELATKVDTNDEWIVTRTGIKERRILKGEGKGTSHLAEQAAKGLLEKTNTDPEDIDLIIIATITSDFIFPSTANLVADMIGAKNAFGFDLAAACSGFAPCHDDNVLPCTTGPFVSHQHLLEFSGSSVSFLLHIGVAP